MFEISSTLWRVTIITMTNGAGTNVFLAVVTLILWVKFKYKIAIMLCHLFWRKSGENSSLSYGAKVFNILTGDDVKERKWMCWKIKMFVCNNPVIKRIFKVYNLTKWEQRRLGARRVLDKLPQDEILVK